MLSQSGFGPGRFRSPPLGGLRRHFDRLSWSHPFLMRCLIITALFAISVPTLALAADPPAQTAEPVVATPSKVEAPPPAVPAKTEPSPAQRELQALITRQQLLLAAATKENNPNFDEQNFRGKMQDLVFDYETYLKKHPDLAAGYAAYGVLLGRIDMRRQSTAMLLKANQLDPNLPIVKNQLGNYLAEEGKPLEAVNYFLAAIKLDPDEPLYHYQLGTLLTEARDDFLKSGEWQRPALDRAMHEAFRRAAELAPNRIEFTYRYGESFYDLEKPDWDGALKVWGALEEHLKPGLEQETVRLHAANILIKQGKFDLARALLVTVTAAPLAKQKEKLVAQLPETEKK
jgi:tetratricopeptide (TPR) repeat protein